MGASGSSSSAVPSRVSVVVPTRNRPALLLRALGSVRAQGHEDWEVLVVDDGDGSGAAAAAALGDARVRVVAAPEPGQVAARNAAVAAATGAVIHLLDDDDRWADPGHLTRVLAALAPGPALAYRPGWLVLERLEPGGPVELSRQPFDPPTTAESLLRDNTLLTSGVAYPRALHGALGRFDPAMGNYWDWDWWLRVTAVAPLVRVGEPAVLMSWRGTNTSADPRRPERLEYLRRLCEKHGLRGVEPKNHETVLGPT